MAVTEPPQQIAVEPLSSADDFPADAVVLDADTVLLAMHRGRRGLELGLQADLDESLARLHEVARSVLAVVEPAPTDSLEAAGRETPRRLDVLRTGLGDEILTHLELVTCPHGEHGECECAKPNAGLVEIALAQSGARSRRSWYVCSDQEGVQAGRSAGLRTIRIGPVDESHLSSVHRPDYEARDLLDAANHILLEGLSSF